MFVCSRPAFYIQFAEQIVMTDKSLRCFSVLVGLAVKRLTLEVISYEAGSIFVCIMILYYFISYPAYKSRLLCVVLYFHPWSVWLYCSTFSHKRCDFREKKDFAHKMRALTYLEPEKNSGR